MKQGSEIAPRIRQRTDQPTTFKAEALRAQSNEFLSHSGMVTVKRNDENRSRLLVDKFRAPRLGAEVVQLGNTPNSVLQ